MSPFSGFDSSVLSKKAALALATIISLEDHGACRLHSKVRLGGSV